MQPVSSRLRSFTRAGCARVYGLRFSLVGTSFVYSPGTTELRPTLGSWSIQHQRKLVEVSKMRSQKSKLRIRPGTDVHMGSANQAHFTCTQLLPAVHQWTPDTCAST